MSRKMTSSEFMRREFEKEVKKIVILVNQDLIEHRDFKEAKTERRILLAYNIAEMRTALREAQQEGGE